ncbi:hypothetical protein V1511DRAFT_461384 [Dipodascopsis uninucleata]
MIKTGATVLWKRLPIHFVTTLRQVPYFQVYSDQEDLIGGHQVVDVLQNMSTSMKNSDDFELYRIQQEMLENHANTLPEAHSGINHNNKGWSLDKYKNLPMLQHAWSVRPQAKWFIFMDADSYVFWTPMLRWLRTLNYRHALYMGSAVGNPPVQFAHGGSVAVLSRGAMLRTFGNDPDLYGKYDAAVTKDCCGDHMVAKVLYDHGIKMAVGDGVYPYAKWRFQGEPQWLVFTNKHNWCAPILSFHHISPRDIEEIHQFELEFRKTHHDDQPIRYVDVYHKFMHDYLEEEKDDWDNRSNDREYSPSYKNAFRTSEYTSLEKCKKACEDWSECVGWRKGPDFCGLSKSVRLGRRVVRYGEDIHNEGIHWISGWMLDRIRKIRSESGCDYVEDEHLGPKDVSEIRPEHQA